MNNPRFQIKRSDRSNEYFYHLRSKNGEIILSGESYTTKQNCINAIVSVKENSSRDSRYVTKDAIGNYTFNLKAANGEIIGRSENYTTKSARDNGILAVKNDGPQASIEDLTL
jgi:uncharacterized protein YegP (UPF0339 family)